MTIGIGIALLNLNQTTQIESDRSFSTEYQSQQSGVQDTKSVKVENEQIDESTSLQSETVDCLPFMSNDCKVIFETLQQSERKQMAQAELVRITGFTASKVSRNLAKLEASGLIERTRDGMGKQIRLTESGVRE